MSAFDFLNSFTNGFSFGLLNSNPMFGCMNIFSNPFINSCWNCTSVFTPFMPMFTSSFTPSFTPTLSFTPENFWKNYNSQTTSTSTTCGSGGWSSNFWNNINFTGSGTGGWLDNFWSNINISGSTQSSTVAASAPISYDAESLKSKWSRKKSGLSNEFYNKVVSISQRINCDPNDLMAVMYSESRISATARNKNGGATGLIQFMPSTAKSLGTSTDALASMTPEQQLDYVEKYYVRNKASAGLGSSRIDRGTLYALTFLPARAGRETLTTSNEKYYTANINLDRNNDGQITKSELAGILMDYMA